MDICAFHEELISEYARFSRSFTESTRQGLVFLVASRGRGRIQSFESSEPDPDGRRSQPRPSAGVEVAQSDGHNA